MTRPLPVIPLILSVPSREPRTNFDQFGSRFDCVYHICDTDHLGAAEQTRRAFIMADRANYAPGKRGDKRHLLFAEDDVILHPELPDAIARLLQPGAWPEHVAVISFCDMREMDPDSPNGLYTRSALGCDGRGWWGNQLLLIHYSIVHQVADLNWFSTFIENCRGIRAHKEAYGDNGRNCSDVRLSLLIHYHCAPRNSYAVHVPSLGFHIGTASACFPDRQLGMGERYTRNWLGNKP